jgi:hypothetical protein
MTFVYHSPWSLINLWIKRMSSTYRVDPFICGVSLLISVPLLVAGLIYVKASL